METKNNNAALLIMDMQEMLIPNIPHQETLIKNNKLAIAHAHQLNIPVIYIIVGFRDSLAEIDMNNKSFQGVKQMNIPMEKWMTIAPQLAPQENETIVVKKRFSAFAGSDLELVLRAQNIRHLVLTGIVTSGVVLSTVTEASDKDFQITVLSDACQDRDETVHDFLMEKIFPRYADVKTVKTWIG